MMERPVISHVQVPVTDLNRAVAWYTDVFGWELEGNFGDFASVRLGNRVNLFLWKTEDETTANFTVGGVAYPVLGVEVSDIEGLAGKVEGSGAKILGGIVTDEDGRRFLKFRDPFGNLIVTHEEPNPSTGQSTIPIPRDRKDDSDDGRR
ncbi:VOC family protein [Paenibacillus sp. MWE-103]|uniref:VOC family protein n=1 Tax=Paenibacillus artemisiicola TaxID=1172618 RepID=A0ABS3W9T4_9BACL|nr:VOC family protein [Paenibacillus artemisiicola]MBO7745084.1 VOC family protein [Paenibacillus artemisiicola]